MTLAPVALLAAAAWGAAAPAAAPGPQRPYWLKRYEPAAYAETLSAELTVRSLDEVPKLVADLEKAGAKLSQPLANFARSDSAGEQQLSFSAPRDKKEAVLKALRRRGPVAPPRVGALGAPVPLDEVRAKLARLLAERDEKKGVLAQMPATAEILDELIDHLTEAQSRAEAAAPLALWNLSVRAAPKAGR